MKRKILITGATGLVGSHILLDILSKGHFEVYALKREKSNLTPLERLFEFKAQKELLDQVNWIHCDLGQQNIEESILERFDEIIHTAAIVSFNPDDYDMMQKINVSVTNELIRFAQSTGVKKFGFISSIAALGRMSTSGKYTEEAEWIDNDSNSYYSKTKYEAEKLVIEANSENFATYIVNPGVILGPCNWDKSSGTIFRTGAKGIAFYTNGQNGFVDVRDVSRGIIEVMENGSSGERHILVGENVPYRRVFSEICLAFDNKPPRIFSPNWLTELGWRLDKFKSRLKGVAPTLTKETARNAKSVYQYDNSKMLSKQFVFTPISETIRYSIPYFKKYHF